MHAHVIRHTARDPPRMTCRGFQKSWKMVPDDSWIDLGSTGKSSNEMFKKPSAILLNMTFDWPQSYPKSPRNLQPTTKECQRDLKKMLSIGLPLQRAAGSPPRGFRGCLRRFRPPESGHHNITLEYVSKNYWHVLPLLSAEVAPLCSETLVRVKKYQKTNYWHDLLTLSVWLQRGANPCQ